MTSIWKALRTAEYPELLAAVAAQPGWDRESAQAVHSALLGWCERALAAKHARGGDSCTALYDLLGRLRSVHGEAPLDAALPGTSQSWRTLESLLSERLAKQQLHQSQRSAVLERLHVQRVIQLLVQRGSLAQKQLQQELGVSESTVSQVLSRMEAAQMIERTRNSGDGRTREVRLADEEARLQAANGPDAEGQNASEFHAGLALAFGTRRGLAPAV